MNLCKYFETGNPWDKKQLIINTGDVKDALFNCVISMIMM